MKKKKGFIKVLKGKKEGKEIEVLYYPSEYSMEKSNTFSEIAIPGLESPYLEFVKGNAASISLEVFYDTHEEGVDVRKYTDQLTELMNIDISLHAPPPLMFIWGFPKKEPFYCVLEKASKKFTMFNSDGFPVRARIGVTLKEFKIDLNDREKKLQSPDKTKIHVTRLGDSLWALAHKEYGTPALWRPIADENRISNPRILEPGMKLIIPPLE